MRRTLSVAAVLVAPVLLLTACGSSGHKSSSASSSPVASASAPAASASPSTSPPPPVPAAVDSSDNLPSVSGSVGKDMTVKLPSSKPDGKFVVHALVKGSGAAVASTDSAVYRMTVLDWTNGKTLQSAYGTGGAPLLLQSSASSQSLAPIEKAVVGQTVGSRVVSVAPPAAATEQMDPSGLTQLKIAKGDTLVFVVDVLQKVSPKDTVSGTATAPPATMPSVDDQAGKAATFTIPAAARTPAKLETAVLIKGTGAKVTAGQTLVAQYTGAQLSNGKVFDSSWSHGGATAFAIGEGQVIKGWDQALVGQTVGSRVLISIPASLAYGASPPSGSGIAKNADLVFVVDILAAAQA